MVGQRVHVDVEQHFRSSRVGPFGSFGEGCGLEPHRNTVAVAGQFGPEEMTVLVRISVV